MDSRHFEQFDNFVDKSEDWHSDLRGGGLFGD